MTGIVLQARLDSTRLPGKALLELAPNRPLLLLVMQALARIRADVRILATEPASARVFRPLARRAGFEVLVGSRDNVLGRFCSAARAFNLDTIVRATGDNPLVSFELASRILDEHLRIGADCSGYNGIAIGSGVEVLSRRALLAAGKAKTDGYEREHVTPYLYRHPELFGIHRPLAGPAFRSNARITVDTPEDYTAMRGLFDRLYRGRPIGSRRLLAFLAEQGLDAPRHA
jgi:spore coat polysaccharide biosynthesis protein SpsF